MNRLLQRLLLGVALIGLLSVSATKQAEAQTVMDTRNWEVLSDSVGWLSDSGNETRGLAFNPATGNVLVATRAGGPAIKIVDGTDGSEVGELDLSGVTGGMFAINRIDVTMDGQIFVGNFSLNGPDYRIYRWENESAEPVRVFDGDPINARVGDGFGVTGTGDDVKVYASGTFSDRLAEFSWNPDEEMLDEPRIITLPDEDHANATILAAPGEDALWINGRDATILKIDMDGEVLMEIGPDVVAPGNGELELIVQDEKMFLVTGVRGPEDNVFSVIDISEDAPLVVAVTEDLTVHPNSFRVADIAYDDATSSLTLLVTNSGIFNVEFNVDEIITDQLLGPYHIPQGDFARGFASLKDAFDELNDVGANGPVHFIITDDLDEGDASLRIDREDLTSNERITIRTYDPATQYTVTAREFRFAETGYITIEGELDEENHSNLTLMKNDDGGGFIGMFGSTRDIYIRNLSISYLEDFGRGTYAMLINRQETAGNETGRGEGHRIENIIFGSDDKPFNDGIWMFGSTTVEEYFHRNNVFHGNEFHIRRSALRTQTHVNTVFENNIVKMYAGTGLQGINLNTPIESFTARNNEFEFVSGTVSDATAHAAINITNTLTEANFYNNTVAFNYDGDGSEHSFYAIRHAGGATSGPLNFMHNTFRIGETGQDGTHAVLGRTGDASTGLTVNMTNNILVSERDAANSIGFDWAAGNLESNYNNFYFEGEGLVARAGEDEFATLPQWVAESGNDQRSVSAEVEFVSESDLRLAGESIGDKRLAGTPLAEVTTDIDGNQRDDANPYMGAFEGDVVLIPEPDIRPFALIQPEDGTEVDLGELEEDVVIGWELPQSTVAWARYNGELLDDQFAHVGNGESGDGRYIGTQNDVDAWLRTPLLENPDTLSFWASTFSNATVLDMVIEISEDGQDWEELETLVAEDGGTGDINVEWSYHQILVEREGEFYIRFSQSGDVAGSFYLDDVTVNSYTFTGEIVIDEDFELWESFRSIRYRWHLDDAGSDFGSPALSLSSDRGGEATTLTLTPGQIDTALDNLDVDPGTTFSGSWTVTAEYRGWVEFAQQPFGISLTRRVPTGSEVDLAYEFNVRQNYPNPFNPTTRIEFTLPSTLDVRLDVYSVTGQRVATLVNEQREAGVHTVDFDATRLASGIYIYRVSAGEFVQTRTMTLVK